MMKPVDVLNYPIEIKDFVVVANHGKQENSQTSELRRRSRKIKDEVNREKIRIIARGQSGRIISIAG